jgi:colanic acid/amylovoran biosynthesis glycosyltransferase
MSGYAKLLGFLNYTEYLNEIQKADIFIHPSVTASDGDSEGGAPTSILEAQAMGMPIISTTHADIPNIVVSGKSALLSPERNSKELANDINYLLDNQNLWGEMGKIGREFVQKYHNINQEIVSLEEHYKGLLHNY